MCHGVSVPRVEKLAATTISFHEYIDRSRVPSGCGLLSVMGGGEMLSVDRLMEDLSKLYNFDSIFTRSYEWGFGMPKFLPGRYRQIAAFRNRPRKPGFIFCGDYLMGSFIKTA